MRMLVARWLGVAGIGLATPACVVHETRAVNAGYGYSYAATYEPRAGAGDPSPYSVSSMPPEPLYEQMTSSPGLGHVWIDGYWHWNGYEWVWVGGRWEREPVGRVYVQPLYDYA